MVHSQQYCTYYLTNFATIPCQCSRQAFISTKNIQTQDSDL